MRLLSDFQEMMNSILKYLSVPLVLTLLGALVSAIGAFSLAVSQAKDNEKVTTLNNEIKEMAIENAEKSDSLAKKSDELTLLTTKTSQLQQERDKKLISIQLELINKTVEQKSFAEKAYLDQQKSSEIISLLQAEQNKKTEKVELLTNEINNLTTETLNRFTSKDSYSLIRIGMSKNKNGPPDWNYENASVVLVHSGKYPIRNVHISIVNTDEEAAIGQVNKEDYKEDPKIYHKVGYAYTQTVPVLLPKQAIQLPSIKVLHRAQKSFNIYFTSDNDFWFQRIMLRDLEAFGKVQNETPVFPYSTITQVYRQDLSEKLNQVYRHEVIIREGRGWDGDEFNPEKDLYKAKA